ncbi:MAG: DNA-3-methyladenine glycosylase [Polyangiaceae bacterium]|nr:DNA-3-methyladenine glycosylase [Polyangiaceae bacterium]
MAPRRQPAPALVALPRAFYERPVLAVARDAIGKLLVHESPEGLVAGRIVEAEAYRGPEDLAAHSRGGRRTPRTEAMWGPAGHAYVFFVYGMHWHVNLVTGAVGEPHAVLLRAVEPVVGEPLLAARRGREPGDLRLTNGPGKLCRAFGIDGRHYGADLCEGPLFLAEGDRPRVARSARIGVEYAGSWAARPWRFLDPASRWVSDARARGRGDQRSGAPAPGRARTGSRQPRG